MTEPTLRILSLGAGVQSTTLALMACSGELPGLDAAIFADTGWEPEAVYQQVERLAAEFAAAGITFYRVRKGNLRKDAVNPEGRFAAVPYFVRNPDGSQGLGRRQCTKEYKLEPIMLKCRELLGAAAPNYRYVPRDGRFVEQWIGFSTDEVHRANNRRENLYTRKRFPLLEVGMSRKDCERYLRRAGWGHTVKSACIGCPYHGNRQWREMRDNRPEEWADAVEFDRQIRKGGARSRAGELDGEAFLHRSMLPLDIAPIDVVQRKELREAQLDMFDALEDGDADGCSPFGCRSGEPVEL